MVREWWTDETQDNKIANDELLFSHKKHLIQHNKCEVVILVWLGVSCLSSKSYCRC